MGFTVRKSIKGMGKLPLLILAVSLTMVACKKDDNLGDLSAIQGLGGDSVATTSIDKWIYDTLTVPYNVAVQYRYDQDELDLNKDLVPPMESKIIPVLSSIKSVWIDTYVAEAGMNFMKTLIPKNFLLVGSASWNTDGTITLGEAEGGHEILLYVLNDFVNNKMPGYVKSDSATLIQLFHTIEHEFGHILHQTVLYPATFKTITAGLYTGDWNNFSDELAHEDGFVTAYARSAPNEDFVEMISVMLTMGRDPFEAMIDNIPAGVSQDGVPQATAQASLHQKEAIVVQYFQDVWGIDFYRLQTRVRAALEQQIQ